MERVYLSGSEEIRSAGYAMERAAAEMRHAASSIDHSVALAIERLDYLVTRFEAAAERIVVALDKAVGNA